MPSLTNSPFAKPTKQFGTFLGVYLPSVLTILGVMMYLRFGWVVGNAGFPKAALILAMASGITLITGLSASAIATNMRVGVGGEYFMISRSLGLELGGAIGIPLFLCRVLSLTLYAFGLVESVSFLWPSAWGQPPVQWLVAGIIVIITAIAGKSAEWSLKLQAPILIAVGLSLLALIGGVLTGPMRAPVMEASYATSEGGFWIVFAVFFPAVTGFTAGIGMSGDLKDPKKSIPIGTLLAVATGAVCYFSILALLAVTAKVTPEELRHLDPNAPPIWTNIALFGFWLVYPGMWGAILSSAFGSALSGPRVLQALANDRVFPRWLARTTKDGQPMTATWVAGGIALAAVALGDLNAVGRWVTIFFLTLYVMINLSAAIEALSGDPSYRPTIRVPWYVSLIGCLGAISVMFLISPVACLFATILEIVLFILLSRQAFQTNWGDVRAGMWTALARFALLRLRRRKITARNWRPQILLFTSNPANRIGLVRLANWFNQNRGIVTVCQVVEGDLTRQTFDIQGERERMDEALRQDNLVAFSEVDIVPDFESGIISIAQGNGFAGLVSNTVMFGWPNDAQGLARLLRIMRAVSSIHLSTILARLSEWEGPSAEQRKRIDLWWRGKQNNGDLMLLLAYLLRLNPTWQAARINIFSIIYRESDEVEMKNRLTSLTAEARIKTHTHVIHKPANKTVSEIMHQASADADVVFLGLMLPEDDQVDEYAHKLMGFANKFRNAVFVRNAAQFSGELI